MEKQIVDKLESIDTKMSTLCEAYTLLVHAVCDKKKKVDKKKNDDIKKRNLYSKKKDGSLIVTKSYAQSMNSEEKFFYMNMAENHPLVCLMQETLLFEDYKKLCDVYTQELVNLKIEELSNSAKIFNHISAYKTIQTWLRRDRYANRHR